jgi:hypothetical protein
MEYGSSTGGWLGGSGGAWRNNEWQWLGGSGRIGLAVSLRSF